MRVWPVPRPAVAQSRCVRFQSGAGGEAPAFAGCPPWARVILNFCYAVRPPPTTNSPLPLVCSACLESGGPAEALRRGGRGGRMRAGAGAAEAAACAAASQTAPAPRPLSRPPL